MNLTIKTTSSDFQIIKPSEFLNEIDNLVYVLYFTCTNCLTTNIRMFCKHTIDNELKSKRVYQVEEACKSCGKKTKIEFSKRIKVKQREMEG